MGEENTVGQLHLASRTELEYSVVMVKWPIGCRSVTFCVHRFHALILMVVRLCVLLIDVSL